MIIDKSSHSRNISEQKLVQIIKLAQIISWFLQYVLSVFFSYGQGSYWASKKKYFFKLQTRFDLHPISNDILILGTFKVIFLPKIMLREIDEMQNHIKLRKKSFLQASFRILPN